jgi:hypothetical protein
LSLPREPRTVAIRERPEKRIRPAPNVTSHRTSHAELSELSELSRKSPDASRVDTITSSVHTAAHAHRTRTRANQGLAASGGSGISDETLSLPERIFSVQHHKNSSTNENRKSLEFFRTRPKEFGGRPCRREGSGIRFEPLHS